MRRGINKINWEMKMHLGGEKMHSLLYRAKYLGRGVQMEIHTPVISDISDYGCFKKFGEPIVAYFIDGDERQFDSEEDLIKAIRGIKT
jgi:hypothetical protein